MNVTLLIQCFPPLLCYAGGVAKRYYKLCKSLIEDNNYTVTIITPIDITQDNNELLKYLNSGKLIYKSIEGILIKTLDGTVLGINVFSISTLYIIFKELLNTDICISDDILGRQYIDIICKMCNVPTIFTTHTDITKLKTFRYKIVKLLWFFHNKFINYNIHATTSQIFANKIKVNYIWPILIWSDNFQKKK